MDEKHKEKLKKLLQESMMKIDFQVITLDGKNYCVFNDEQIKKFFQDTADTLWKGLGVIIESHQKTKHNCD